MEKLKLHTPDFTQENIAKLAGLFPNCITESTDEKGAVKRAIDFDQLRQELSSSIVEGSQERYQINWPGKREALLTANAPIAKTLRPCREESVDFDTTQNLFIEGDNLDALKLLQEAYLNKVKLIYIDPPYNTGNDFIYEDDFAEDSEGYLERSNQKDKIGNRLLVNTESNGRFHSDWLSMIYSRLRLSRNLLRDDGVIIISIDDNEVSNLRKICDEIFGEDNFISAFIWKRRQNVDSRSKNGASTDHEYAIVYSKTSSGKLRGGDKDMDKYSNPDNDPKGDWMSADMTGLATKDQRPNLHYDVIDPTTNINYGCPITGWRYEPKRMAELIRLGEVIFPKSATGRPRRKKFKADLMSEFTGKSSILSTVFNTQATRELRELFNGADFFDFPKPLDLIKDLVNQSEKTEENSIILDFFSGSATTAHAVMALNAEDGGKRKYIMVQIPECCEESSESYKSGFKTIADIGKERIRLAGKKIIADSAITAPDLDIGFRVFKIDSSNMSDVFYSPDEVKQGDLLAQINNIREGRNEEDLLFQVLLDWGVDLSLPITREVIAGKNVFFVDGNALAACFEVGIDESFVKLLAAKHPLRAVFFDAGFASDSVKINIEQIFKLVSPTTEIKTI